MRNLMALIAGGMFGAGLLISGMTNTLKVQGWLDVFGDWDPTLAFVMGGGIIPMALAWAYTKNRRPILGGEFPTLPNPEADKKLIVGSVLFGIGWGLAGLCPGPSFASLTFGGIGGIAFVVAMAAGMLLAPKARALLD